ncbi:hypothetical protein GBA63_05665 [Rubrobacter tropicus]|uniref:Rhodanese domain-containing protein n=1 Tax=Rubrobacter tropicus TaxID=2653851 RepID=A0A6G8Q6X1_9ACTN|nr:rhodanese-like domain-containing protein [Rubrobacter tropicus]QIN82189.1 hypothetical protein GBA63_05665 [Rubrobacter tropicus]
MKTIDREELKAKLDRGDDLLLLEVLGEASYGQGHLPGAVRYEGRGQVEGLVQDRSAEVVAYCSNFN